MLIFNRKQAREMRVVMRIWVLMMATAALIAQPLEEMIYTVGTTTKDGMGRDWGYILWQGEAPNGVQAKRYAIYAKSGGASSLNAYARQAVVGVQTDPAVIQVLLGRGENLGENVVQLESRIDTLFQAIIPDPSLSLAEKISAVIRGSLNDANHFNNLIVLARLHPSISLSLGMAHATQLGAGQTTFEVREYDLAGDRDLGVVGRVTVQSGVAVELPAPGIPVAVPDASAKGDLNVRLRWGTTDELRRLSLLNYGFNVYRMGKTYAEANNYHTTPPSAAVLATLLGNPNVRQLNNNPVLQNKQYTIATAANLGLDSTNAFFADDNRRYEPGGVPHENGDQYYYFVAARDVLGRNGKISDGALVTICDRLPPNAPSGVKVVNDYQFVGGVSRQRLKVEWKQDNTNTDTIKNYYVYRWDGPGQVQVLAGNPVLRRIAGPIPHVPGQEWNSYLDDGVGAPSMPADASKTFWYTVRSEDDSACGGNLSPNSGPAFGVLRDRVGPAAPGGFIDLICRKPVVFERRWATTENKEQNQAFAYFNMVCDRKDPAIIWAEFYAFGLAPSNYIGRVHFKPGESRVEIPFIVSRASLVNQREIIFYCRVATSNGRVSFYTPSQNVGVPEVGLVRHALFEAIVDTEKFRPVPGRKGDCFRHDPVPPGDPGSADPITPIDVTIQLTPGTKEYKLYRRIDFGALTLIKQGPADFDDVTSITVPDSDLPPNAGTICYYGQLFDEHGNPSPLTLLGDDCVPVAGTTPLPAPMLAGLEITGTDTSPKMNIKWFCPPFGVERFMVHIAAEPKPMAATISPQLSEYESNVPTVVVYTDDGTTDTNEFYIYRTPRIGPGFGNGAQFDVEVSVLEGRRYTVFVKAVGKDESEGPRSNVEDAIWSPKILVGPQVPWPARPLPPLNVFSTNLLAHRLPAQYFDGVGVHIGWITDRAVPRDREKQTPALIYSDKDPMTYLHTNALGEKVFPVVMYRTQLANTAFPQVSGDLIQVTPLMERIAFDRQIVAGLTQVLIQDPFVQVVPFAAGTNQQVSSLYLLDTQPVVANARYIYLLVRFNEKHEIAEVFPSSIVEVTP
jgi:hypothetical protein